MTHATATLSLQPTRLGSAQREPRWRAVRTLQLLVALVVLSAPKPSLAAPGDITTVAGGVGQGPALSIAQEPAGVAVSGAFVYVADSGNNVVRRLDARTGSEVVVAGTGSQGFSGDDGPATSAQLNDPQDVAVDPAGSLFIADAGNNRIRKVDAAGTIRTVAGTGPPGFGGVGFSGDGGPATSAQLYNAVGVAVDPAGNLFIADWGNHRIRKVDTAGRITTAAGNGSQGFSGDGGPATSAQLNYPQDVAVDAAGNLFIADAGNQRIRKVDTAGTITTVAGNSTLSCHPGLDCSPPFGGDGGPATSALLSEPFGVAVDPAGSLFIADAGNHRIRKVDTAGTITTVAGSGDCDPYYGCIRGFSGDGGPATSAQLNGPSGVAVDSAGNLFIADRNNARIRKVDSAGMITTVAGSGYTGTAGFSGDGGPATSAQLGNPQGVAADPAGNLFIADAWNNRIRTVDAAGTITTVAGGGFGADGGPATSAQLNYPKDVAVDAAGNLFIADAGNQRIRKVDTAGTITTVAGNGTAGFSGDDGRATRAQLNGPSGVAVDAADNLFIADAGNQRIRKVDTAGAITTVAGNGGCHDVCTFKGCSCIPYFGGDGRPATSAQLYGPSGVAVDAAGNVFIADWGNHRIRKVDTAGMITTVAGSGDCNTPDIEDSCIGFSGDGGPATSAQLYQPSGVAVDVAGNLFIADSYNHRIRKVDAAGTITTVAGTGSGGFGGDDGPATSAQLSAATGVAVDPAGNLFIADAGNNRIRMVEALAAAVPTSTPTRTPTASPSTSPTATQTPTATPKPGNGGGCTVTPNHGSGAAWWLLVSALMLAWAQRGKRA